MPNTSEKTIIVTGANTGIGRVTALELARDGATVVYACRNEQKAQEAIDDARAQTGNQKLSFEQLDLNDLSNVSACADRLLSKHKRIDILINNAGLAGKKGITKDGFELAFGVNHLGHFLLTQKLLSRINETPNARIVHVASQAHQKAKRLDWNACRKATVTPTGFPEYQQSKLANVLYNAHLAKKLEGTTTHTYALHPGVVASDVWREVPPPFRWIMKRFMITNEEGALTTLYCARSEKCANESGLYYDKEALKKPSSLGRDAQLAEELWEKSEEWTKN